MTDKEEIAQLKDGLKALHSAIQTMQKQFGAVGEHIGDLLAINKSLGEIVVALVELPPQEAKKKLDDYNASYTKNRSNVRMTKGI